MFALVIIEIVLFNMILFFRTKTHRATLDCLGGEYEVEAGFGGSRDTYLREHGIDTFFIIPPNHRRKVNNRTHYLGFVFVCDESSCKFDALISKFQPLLMNTLGVRSAIGSANRRKLSFRNVSNVVVQLLHTIKYSVPVPFSHLSTPNGNYMSPSQNSSVVGINEANRKVNVYSSH